VPCTATKTIVPWTTNAASAARRRDDGSMLSGISSNMFRSRQGLFLASTWRWSTREAEMTGE
jgi:hypothetical protein